MGHVIAIVGDPGSGKTTSLFPNPAVGIKGLNPKETVILSIGGAGKPLLFPKSKEYYKTGKISEGSNHMYVSSSSTVGSIIKSIDTEPKYKHVKNIVVDDAQFFMMFMFMDKAQEKTFDKFTDIGVAGYTALKAAADTRREDLNVIFTYHPEETNTGRIKIKTSGKMIDQHLTIEGMFSWVFFTYVEFDFETRKPKYWFETQTNGKTTAKTPPGCFEDFRIPNDMGYILDKINAYMG